MTSKRKVRISAEVDTELQKQLEAFRRKFGRDPGPNDPVFFDPDADTPQPISEEVLHRETPKALRLAGTPPQFIHAYAKTGYLLTAKTIKTVPPEARAEWDAAIDEYFAMEDAASEEKH